MKRSLFIFLFTIATGLQAQNLVPNNNFEGYNNCSSTWLYMSNTFAWKSFYSADYFNSCVSVSSYFGTDVPQNYFGYQYPKSGNGMAGFHGFYPDQLNYKEYIYTQLTQPLIANISYCINFSVSLSDSSTWAIKKLGAYFSNDTLYPPPYQSKPTPPFYIFTTYLPQIESNFFLADTNGWTSISGILVASGTEKYITIGNFHSDATTDSMRIQTRSSNERYSYYYIDDISVEEVQPANAGNDTSFYLNDSIQLGNNATENATYSWSPSTGLSDPNAPNPKASPGAHTTYVLTKTQCSVVTKDTVTLTYLGMGINEKDYAKRIKLFPNPNNGSFQLQCELQNNESGMLMIFDLSGNQILSQPLPEGCKSISFSEELPAGMYQYNVMVNGKVVKRDKLVVIK